MRRASGTPPVWSPISTTSSRPLLRSAISWAMRTSARWTSAGVRTWDRGTKVPPRVWLRSRSATAPPVRTGLTGPASRSAKDLTARLSHPRRDRAQDAVHERTRLLGRVGLRQLDRLVEDDGDGGPPGLEQLGHRHAEDQPVDDRHPVERPADRRLGDQLVGPVAVARRRGDEPGREVVRRHSELRYDLARGLALELGLVEEAEGAFARLVASRIVGCHGGSRCASLSRAGRRRADQARVRYSPVRVSTRIDSPGFTNSGTCT